MKIDEILSLIKIRDYMSAVINNSVLERKDISEFGRLLTLIDKKIINTLLSVEFKNNVGVEKIGQIHNQNEQLTVDTMTKIIKNNSNSKVTDKK